MPDADLALAVPAVFFGSVGTAGQRCTSTRRLYLHRAIAPEFLSRLQTLYASPALRPGDPLDASTLLAPLHSRAALTVYDDAVAELREAGAQILVGGDATNRGRYEDLPVPLDGGNFVRPTIARPSKYHKSTAKFTSKAKSSSSSETTGAAGTTTDAELEEHSGSLWGTERFAPVLLVAEFEELEEAIAWNNAVPQGLSSSLWTRDVRHVGKWIGPAGSDAGIVNVGCLFFSPCSFVFCLFFSLVGQRRHERCRDWRRIRREQGRSCRIPLWQWDPLHSHRLFLPFFRAPGGAVNLVATLGNNMCVGAPARSTFPTKHPSHRASILTRHDGEQSSYLPLTRA